MKRYYKLFFECPYCYSMWTSIKTEQDIPQICTNKECTNDQNIHNYFCHSIDPLIIEPENSNM